MSNLWIPVAKGMKHGPKTLAKVRKARDVCVDELANQKLIHTYMDMTKNMYARSNASLNLLQQVKASRSTALVTVFGIFCYIATPQRRTMSNQNICTLWNLLPLFQNIVAAMRVEGPVEEEGRPR